MLILKFITSLPFDAYGDRYITSSASFWWMIYYSSMISKLLTNNYSSKYQIHAIILLNISVIRICDRFELGTIAIIVREL
jgi:hypothetical protein